MKEATNTVTTVATATPDAIVAGPQLNLVPPPTQAEIEAQEAKAFADAQAKKTQALAKFDTTVPFKLEIETVGAKALNRKVSKSGAVSIGLHAKKELATQSGLKGGDLDAWTRMRRDELKAKQSMVAASLSSDNNWSGNAVKLSAKGDKITMEWVKVLPQTVSVAEPTDEQIAKSLDMSVDELKAFKAMKAEAKVKAEADLKAAQELAAEEAKLKADAIAEQARVDAEIAELEKQAAE